MFDVIMSWLDSILGFVLNVFVTLLDSTGTGNFYLTSIYILIIMSALILPLLSSRGSRGSDTASKKRGSKKGDE